MFKASYQSKFRGKKEGNIFLIKDNKLVTPELLTVLDGITRKTIITLANDLGLETIQRKVELKEVFDCDEAFFTGTAAEVTPIIEIDKTKINNGIPGPITKMLQENYFSLIRGTYDKHDKWLTVISDS